MAWIKEEGYQVLAMMPAPGRSGASSAWCSGLILLITARGRLASRAVMYHWMKAATEIPFMRS